MDVQANVLFSPHYASHHLFNCVVLHINPTVSNFIKNVIYMKLSYLDNQNWSIINSNSNQYPYLLPLQYDLKLKPDPATIPSNYQQYLKL